MPLAPIDSWIRPQDERFSLLQGATQRITVADLIGDDTGIDGAIISLVSVAQPAHGSLALQADGSYLYTPAPGYMGLDSFSYVVGDQFGNICTEGVEISIGQGIPNQAPWVQDEYVEVRAGVPVSAHESALLANDADADGGTLSVANYSQPAHGTLSRAADGTLTYTANPGYSGEDSFTYEVSDGQGGVTVGTVHFNVACPANQAPVVQNEFVTILADTPVSAHESALLGNDWDPEGGPLTVQSLGQPANGTLVRAADGTLTYTPKPGFVGTDSFSYVVADAQGLTSTGTVTLQVSPNPNPPTLGAPTVTLLDDANNDGVLSSAEAQPRVDVRIGLPQGAKAGDILTLEDQSGQLVAHKLTADEVAAGTVRLDDVFATPADGQPLSVSAFITPASGPASPKGSDSAVVDTSGPGTPTVTITSDANNDGVISKAELAAAGGVDARIELPQGAVVGDTLLVTDQDGHKLRQVLTADDIAAGFVTLDNAFPVPAEGATVTLTAALADSHGNTSPEGRDSATLTTQAPGVTVSLVDDANNDGRLTRAELNGATRADVRVDLPQGAAVGDELTLRDNAGNSTSRVLTAADIAAGAVSFAEAFPLPASGSTLVVTAKLTDTRGNVSPESSDAAYFNGNFNPIAVDDVASVRAYAPGFDNTVPQTGGNVLSNDTDPDGPTANLRVAGVATSANVAQGQNVGQVIEGLWGHLTVNYDGSYTYVADKSAGLTAATQDVFYYLPLDGTIASDGTVALNPAKLSITVDPALSNVTAVTAPDAAVVEGNALVFGVTVTASPVPTTMSLAVLSGTGTAGVDTTTPLQVNFGAGWVDVTGNTVSVPAHTTHYEVRVPTVDDTQIEQTETISLKVTSATGSTAQAEGGILDNDTLQVLKVEATGNAVTEGQAVEFTVSTTAVQVDTPLTLKLSSGTATVGTDTSGPLQVNFGKGWVNVVDGTVTQPAGSTQFSVRVPTVDDAAIEPGETFSLQVTAHTGSTASGQATILDNDGAHGQAYGTEDTPLTLTWANFNLGGMSSTPEKLIISSLPKDGTLQVNNGGSWANVTLNQEVSKADIDAGKLRFIPDANEAGCDAYRAAGVGNKLNDYAKFNFSVVDTQGGVYSNNDLTIDITPVADWRNQAFTPTNLAPAQGYLAGIGVRVDLNMQSSGDSDGSERAIVTVYDMTNFALQGIYAGQVYYLNLNNGTSSIHSPTGSFTLNEGVSFHVPTGYNYSYTAYKYSIVLQEIAADGSVISQTSGPSGNMTFGQTSWGPSSPLILDLNQDGVQTVGIEAGVTFDHTNTGTPAATGWVDAHDGLLVLDRNGDGAITNGAELFGDNTLLANGSKASDGFAALAEFDGNGDGSINAQDAIFASLQVWVDENTDGVSQASELHGLADVGVAEIHLAHQASDRVQNGNELRLIGSYTDTQGQSHEMVDAWFATTPATPQGEGEGEGQSQAGTLNAADLLQTSPTLDAVLPAANAEPLVAAVEAPLPSPVEVNAELTSLQWHHTGWHRELMTETAMF